MGKVYRIGTFKVSPVATVGDKDKGHQQAMAILWCLAGIIEKQELLKKYPRLGIEINETPIDSKEAHQ